jgi:hypothetical protein
MSASGGGRSSSETKLPKLNSVSPLYGKAFTEAAKLVCLELYPSVVPLFNKGLMPIEMLESDPPYNRRSLLARKAGAYVDDHNQPIRVSQTAVDYRKDLISTTEKEMKVSTAQAIKLLWPDTGKKSRETIRANIARESQAFLQCLMQLYPSSEVALKMSLCEPLNNAETIVDVIAWTVEFDVFCLSSQGSKEHDIAMAEKAVTDTKMKALETLLYVKRFKQAANDAVTCGSKWDNERYVSTFFRNLNQEEDAFHRHAYRYLDENDHLHRFLTEPLQKMYDYATQFHNTTILTSQARRKEMDSASLQSRNKNYNNGQAVTTLSDLSKAIENTNGKSKSNTVTVSHQILATLVKKASNEETKRNAAAAAKKEEVLKKRNISDADDSAANKKVKTETRVKKPCFKFAAPEGCNFGDKCRFAHN